MGVGPIGPQGEVGEAGQPGAAHPDDYFAAWSGDCAAISREQPCVLTHDRDLVIGAEFWDGSP